MKKFVLILAVSFCICVSYAESNPKLFMIGNGLGLVKNNTVDFYLYDDKDDLWKIDPTFSMKLPDGYSNVFSTFTGLGVVKNNTVEFYTYKDGSWIINPALSMKLN
jgi:hypothetical protein